MKYVTCNSIILTKAFANRPDRTQLCAHTLQEDVTGPSPLGLCLINTNEMHVQTIYRQRNMHLEWHFSLQSHDANKGSVCVYICVDMCVPVWRKTNIPEQNKLVWVMLAAMHPLFLPYSSGFLMLLLSTCSHSDTQAVNSHCTRPHFSPKCLPPVQPIWSSPLECKVAHVCCFITNLKLP